MNPDERDLSEFKNHPELTAGGPISGEEREQLEREDQAEPTKPADRRLNTAIPVLIATTVIGSPPTSALPPGAKPTELSELSQKYINQTVPVLEMIDFHECLGIISDLSPTVRLVIGCGVLGLGVAMCRPPQKGDDGGRKKRKRKEAEGREKPARTEDREE